MGTTICLSSRDGAGSRTGRKLVRELLDGPPADLRACYIGAAHGDSPWAKTTLGFLEDELGMACAAPRLSDPGLDVAAARAAIEAADLLYLDGGDPVALIRHARARRVVEALRDGARQARLVYGLSAGACAAAALTIRYVDGEPELVQGLDLGPPHPVDVHDEPEWGEMRDLLTLLARERSAEEACGIAIPTGSALIVRPGGQLESRGKLPCEKRRLSKQGDWHLELVPPG